MTENFIDLRMKNGLEKIKRETKRNKNTIRDRIRGRLIGEDRDLEAIRNRKQLRIKNILIIEYFLPFSNRRYLYQRRSD